MITKIDFLAHKANDLQGHFDGYLRNIKDLPAGTVFIGAHFPNPEFSSYILKSKDDGSQGDVHKLFEQFQQSFLILDKKSRRQFLKIFEKTNDITWVLRNPKKVLRKSQYPGTTGRTSHALLVHLFNESLKLIAFNIKEHYKQFFDARTNAWCPFCASERYKWPEDQREDYDHLLCKKDYPAAAINFKNLIPMGDRCNRIYKKDKDILLNAKGSPTKVAYSYSETIKPKISLRKSTFHVQPEKRNWIVTISPNTQQVSAWNEIFEISERLKKEFLVKRNGSNQIPEYDTVVKIFIEKCKEQKSLDQIKGIIGDWSLSDLDNQLTSTKNSHAKYYYMDSNLQKETIYDYLLNHARKTYKRAILRMINE